MVLTPKKPHIGNTIIHPTQGLHYAYYGTVQSPERVKTLLAQFAKERQWTFTHEVPGKGTSIFHRHATLEHAKIPFGKVPPKEMMSFEEAIARSQQGKPRKHRQSEPGAKDTVVPKEPRIKMTEQEKRAKKLERRATRRLKRKEDRANAKVQSVLGQIRPDFTNIRV